MKRTLIFIMLFVMLAAALCGCSAEPAESSSGTPTRLNIGMLAGPTGVGAAKLMSDAAAGSTQDSYNFTVFSSPDEVTAKFIRGELDAAAVPTNLAAVLYKKTDGKARIAAINTLGVLYVLTAQGTQVASVEDLRGKTVYSSGLGAVPEYALNYILDAAGIRDEVEVIYETEHDAVIADLAAGRAKVAVLPEPKVTAALAKVEGLTVALDLTDEWSKAAKDSGEGSVLTMGCVIVNSDFEAAHPEAVVNFLHGYENSVAYMINGDNLDTAAALCEQFGIIPKAAIAKKAIPNCNMTFISGAGMKESVSAFYDVLYNYDPASVGGALPDDEFYYGN